MRLPKPRHLLICLALTGAFGHAGAAELRHLAAEPAPAAENVPGQLDRLEDVDIDGAVAASHAQRTQKPKAQPAATTTPRTANDNRMLPARFHSFLPGMFR